MATIKIDSIVVVLNSLIDLIVELDPNAASNPIIVELKKVIGLVQTLGL